MAYERTCFVCLKNYRYCANNCKDFDPNKTWMYLVHDERCLDIYNLWQQYRGKEITKADAAAALKAMKVDDIIATNSPVVPVLKEILNIKDVVKEENVEEKKFEDEAPAVGDKTEEVSESSKPEPKEQQPKKGNTKYNNKK